MTTKCFSLNFTRRITIVKLFQSCAFFYSLRRYVSIGENKPETKSELNNFHTQMWHKYVKLSVREEKTKTIPTAKTKRKIVGFECCSRIFCVFVTIHVIVRIRLSFFLAHFATAAYCCFFVQTSNVCVRMSARMCGCVCVQMTRWYSNVVASLTCLVMHILNFVRSIKPCEFFFFVSLIFLARRFAILFILHYTKNKKIPMKKCQWQQ